MDNFMMQPIEASQASESVEQIDAQRLDDLAYEPSAYIEQSGDYKESEAIQTGLTTVVDNVSRIAVEPINAAVEVACDGSSKEPAYSERVSAMPEPIPQPSEGVSAMPEPIPQPSEGVSAMPEPIPQPSEGVSAMPEPIPQPSEGVSAIPEPIPQPSEGVSAIPEPIPQPS